MTDRRDVIIHHYATEIERIVNANTVGEYTWIGLLSEFAQELAQDTQHGHSVSRAGTDPIATRT